MPARFSRTTAATLCATAFAALYLVSCSDTQQPPTPTAPTQNSGTRSPAPEPTRHLTGAVVDAQDTRVPGVALTFYSYSGQVRTTSDADGFFDVTVDPWRFGLEVGMEKPGFESSSRFISVGPTTDVHFDLRLYPVVRVAPGESMRLSLQLNDPSCGFDFEYLCRTVRIASSARGTVTVEVVPDRSGAELGVALADLFLSRTLTPRFSFEIAAGGERSIYVLLWFAAPQAETFTLKTSFDRSAS